MHPFPSIYGILLGSSVASKSRPQQSGWMHPEEEIGSQTDGSMPCLDLAIVTGRYCVALWKISALFHLSIRMALGKTSMIFIYLPLQESLVNMVGT